MSSSFDATSHAEQSDYSPLTARYDEQTQQRIISLASQLKTHHEQTLSGAELEAAAKEAGLEPTFIRQAIAQLATKDATEAGPVKRLMLSRQTPLASAKGTMRAAKTLKKLTIGLGISLGLYAMAVGIICGTLKSRGFHSITLNRMLPGQNDGQDGPIGTEPFWEDSPRIRSAHSETDAPPPDGEEVDLGPIYILAYSPSAHS